MSVNDPYIRELKGCMQKLLQEVSISSKISDSFSHLRIFCEKLEHVFYSGLLPQPYTAYFLRANAPYLWMSNIIQKKPGFVGYGFVSSVDKVDNCSQVCTDLGRFRHFIRNCLSKKCLHLPVQYLITYDKHSYYYRKSSILGDEILSQIFLSVLLQCTVLNFELDLSNSSFLDESWFLPDVLKIELVPCKALGLGVRFSEEKAIITSLQCNGVAEENGSINVGDILHEINGVHINSGCKGKLCSVIRSSKNKPVNVTIIKAVKADTGDIFLPIRKYLLDAQVDILAVKNKNLLRKNSERNKYLSSNGYKCLYVGSVKLGSEGDKEHIAKSIRIIIQSKTFTSKSTKYNKIVIFETHEIGVKILDFHTEKVILKADYMNISACGLTPYAEHYFAFIVGDPDLEPPSQFTCYVFYSTNNQEVCTILKAIGQGFQTTHFAV